MSIGLTMKSLLFFIFILCVMIFIKSVFDEWDWCKMYNAKCCFFMVSIFTVIDLPVSIFEWQIKTTAICWYGELFPLTQVQNFCASWLYSLRRINAQILHNCWGLSHFSQKNKIKITFASIQTCMSQLVMRHVGTNGTKLSSVMTCEWDFRAPLELFSAWSSHKSIAWFLKTWNRVQES